MYTLKTIIKEVNIMNVIYRCKIKTHPSFYNPECVKYITLFYDESREEVINYMQKYDKENGFTYIDHYGKRNTFANLILTEETTTGEVISIKTYREIFDHLGNRLDLDAKNKRRVKNGNIR